MWQVWGNLMQFALGKTRFVSRRAIPKNRELMIAIHYQVSGRVHTHPHTRCGGFTIQKLYTQKTSAGYVQPRGCGEPCTAGAGAQASVMTPSAMAVFVMTLNCSAA